MRDTDDVYTPGLDERSWSPYLWFVWLIAQLVDGTYPAHFDSHLHRRVRVLFVIAGIVGCAGAISQYRLTGFSGAPISTFSPRTRLQFQFSIVVLLGLICLCVFAALLRLQSLQQHLLEGAVTVIQPADCEAERTDADVVDDSAVAAADATTLYKFVKVFFVLSMLCWLPDLAGVVPGLWGSPVRIGLQYVTMPFTAYYTVFVAVMGGALGGRWVSRSVTNDQDTVTDHASS